MKLFLATALLGFLPLALAAKSLKSVVVTFPKNTPDSVISKAKDSLVASGGIITHEYQLIKGFAAEAPVHSLHSLSAESTEYKPEIEEDKVVTANGDYEGEEHSF